MPSPIRQSATCSDGGSPKLQGKRAAWPLGGLQSGNLGIDFDACDQNRRDSTTLTNTN
jgi:hypothetical protein